MKNKMKVVVTGGRDFKDADLMDRTLKQLPISILAHGNASGADQLAGKWAALNGIPVQLYHAYWKIYGKMAGPIRNRAMLDGFKPDLVIAFKGGRGTEDCIKAARERGITIHDARG